jgi:hypothetical protein
MKSIRALAVLILFVAIKSQGSEVSISRTSSDNSSSLKVYGQHKFEDQSKASASVKSSQDDTAANDNQAAAMKVAYAYLGSDNKYTSFEFKFADEFYSFSSRAIGLRTSYDINESIVFGLGFEGGAYQHDTEVNEKLGTGAITLGFDFEISEALTMGFDVTGIRAVANGPQLKDAIDGFAISNQDISDFASSLNGRIFSLYGEYAFESLDVGASLTTFTSMVSQSRSSSSEVFAVVPLGEEFEVSLNFSRSRSEASSNVSSSTTIELAYQF